MNKCVIYSRVSTNQQTDTSQKEDLIKYAKANNFKVVAMFGETVSGFDLTKERLELENMKKYAVSNSIKHVLIWELSRLGRSSLQTLKEIDFCRKQGINIYFKKENLNTLSDDPTNKLLLGILTSMAELERSNIVERSHRGKMSAAEKGSRIGFAIMPYGFKSIEGKIAIDEEEAEVVRKMYNISANGTSLKGVANHLNSLGIKTRNFKRGMKRTLRTGIELDILWRPNTVRKILRSTLYKGERLFKNQLVVKIPAIVDVELWDKVQARFDNNLGYICNTKYDYLLKGKIFCGHCGLAYMSRTENRYASKPSFYFCPGRRDKGIRCKNGQFKSTVFDDKVYDLLFRHSDVMLKVYKDSLANFDIESKNNQIEFYKNQQVSLDAKKKRVMVLYKDGYLGESEFKSEQSAIRKESIDIDNNIAKIERDVKNFNGVNLAENLTSLLKETDFSAKHEFVQKYVDKVLIHQVTKTSIDFTTLSHTVMKTMVTTSFRNPHGNDKVVYVEVFAFGNEKPLKIVLSNVTEICYTSDKLAYEDGVLSIKDSH